MGAVQGRRKLFYGGAGAGRGVGGGGEGAEGESKCRPPRKTNKNSG